jgi:hypothetical protein
MNKRLLALLFFLSACEARSQVVKSFDVPLPEGTTLSFPVCMTIDNKISDPGLSLWKIDGNKKTEFPFQTTKDKPGQICWQVEADGKPVQHFELLPKKANQFASMEMHDHDGELTISTSGKKLLNFFYRYMYPPPGIDTSYKRSGFIHPLWTPHQQELTRVQPPDHYHHYGIWNPWTKVLFEKDTVDFWNLDDKKGTVRFKNFQSVETGPVFAEFKTNLDHIVLKNGNEKTAINEMQTVRVYNMEPGSDHFILDFTSVLSCATNSPVRLLTYRYGGLGFRATEFWNGSNSEVLTSEGKTRENTDATKARWCIIQGELPGNDYGGIAFFSHPENYNHPEPIRIWVKEAEDNGDMFFNFSPTKDRDWLLEPGKNYVLRYRMVVFNGKMKPESIEAAWISFAETK